MFPATVDRGSAERRQSLVGPVRVGWSGIIDLPHRVGGEVAGGSPESLGWTALGFSGAVDATMDTEQKDYEAYKSYVELWAGENPIKTNKLQVLLVVNGLLVSALQVAGGFTAENWPLFVSGGVFSLIWVLSIGRTSLFQQIWQAKARAIASKSEYKDDPRFHLLNTDAEKNRAPKWLRLLGAVSSKYYLLGAPLVFSVSWFVCLVYVLTRSAGSNP